MFCRSAFSWMVLIYMQDHVIFPNGFLAKCTKHGHICAFISSSEVALDFTHDMFVSAIGFNLIVFFATTLTWLSEFWFTCVFPTITTCFNWMGHTKGFTYNVSAYILQLLLFYDARKENRLIFIIFCLSYNFLYYLDMILGAYAVNHWHLARED